MRKTFKIVILFTILSLLVFPISIFAQTHEDLDTLQITLNKTIVHPGEEVEVSINFGQELGSYDVNIDFDDDLFEYVRTSKGTASATGDIVSISFFDAVNPTSIDTVTFRAKTGITTSNPTQFLITLTGMANPTDTVRFNDTVPIVKDVLVEPAYVDYKITVEYKEPIVKGADHPIDVRIKSTMGKYYDHLRLIAEVETPQGGTMRLLGLDNSALEHDVILSGWGEAAGFGLGGTVDMVYKFVGIFSEDGEYRLTLKLIDRDDSDRVIASSTNTIRVGEIKNNSEEILPRELPRTGVNIYLYLIIVAFVILAAYTIIDKKQ